MTHRKTFNSLSRNELGEGSHIYFNARYYDPEVGRFLTEDPSRKGTSWYTYCNNNPLRFTDPTGRRAIIDEDEYGRPVYADPREERRERERNRREPTPYDPFARAGYDVTVQKALVDQAYIESVLGLPPGTACVASCEFALMGVGPEVLAPTIESLSGFYVPPLVGPVEKGPIYGGPEVPRKLQGTTLTGPLSENLALRSGSPFAYQYAPAGARTAMTVSQFVASTYKKATIELSKISVRTGGLITHRVAVEINRETGAITITDPLDPSRAAAQSYTITAIYPKMEVPYP